MQPKAAVSTTSTASNSTASNFCDTPSVLTVAPLQLRTPHASPVCPRPERARQGVDWAGMCSRLLGLLMTLAVIFGMLAALGAVSQWHGIQSGPPQAIFQKRLVTTESPPTPRWCTFGSAPGTWSSGAALGNHWTLFDHHCRLQDLLPIYTKQLPPAAPDLDSSGSNLSRLAPMPTTPTAVAATAGVLFLSDSVDKHVLEYLCQLAGGNVKSIVSKVKP